MWNSCITCRIHVITCEIRVITCRINVITCEIRVIRCDLGKCLVIFLWQRPASPSHFTLGSVNSTFDIATVYSYYHYYSGYQRFKLRAWLPKLDRETISKYNIEITCKNLEYRDAKKAVTTIHIDILDSNDNLPVFEKEIYFTKIPKNIQSGEDIIQVHATDDDANENGKIRYSLVLSGDSYIFNIDKTLGVISLRDKEKLMKPK